jgi:hypothetical protein
VLPNPFPVAADATVADRVLIDHRLTAEGHMPRALRHRRQPVQIRSVAGHVVRWAAVLDEGEFAEPDESRDR